jgi:hypothetical protein
VVERVAEVARHGPADELEVLDDDRAVEAVVGADLGDLLLGEVVGHEVQHRVATEADEEEDDHRDAEQHRDHLQQTSGDVGRHRGRCPLHVGSAPFALARWGACGPAVAGAAGFGPVRLGLSGSGR